MSTTYWIVNTKTHKTRFGSTDGLAQSILDEDEIWYAMEPEGGLMSLSLPDDHFELVYRLLLVNFCMGAATGNIDRAVLIGNVTQPLNAWMVQFSKRISKEIQLDVKEMESFVNELSGLGYDAILSNSSYSLIDLNSEDVFRISGAHLARAEGDSLVLALCETMLDLNVCAEHPRAQKAIANRIVRLLKSSEMKRYASNAKCNDHHFLRTMFA